MTATADEQLQKIRRVREVLRGTRMVLGLIVVLGLSSLGIATNTATPDRLYAAIAGWFFGQVVLLALAAAGLRALRRRRFGARPSTRVPRTSDALLHVASVAGGLLALLLCGHTAAGGGVDAVTIGAGVLGLALLISGLRMAALYVLRE